jgi:hypothetical protein
MMLTEQLLHEILSQNLTEQAKPWRPVSGTRFESGLPEHRSGALLAEPWRSVSLHSLIKQKTIGITSRSH